jgi:ribulose-phosphate 3-epimerase
VAVQISPSILASDFANLERELKGVANADWAHVDVMDAHFVPNLTVGLPVVEALARVSPIPLDCHLMIDNPDRWAPRYAEAGASSVTFHIEAAHDPISLARSLRGLGVRAGMALKPGTAFAPYADLLPELDMVLVMTVEPGFGGQSFMAAQLPKVREVREAVARSGGEIWVQVDGGVSAANIEACAEAGADVFVAGSAVFGAEVAAAAVDQLRELAGRHSRASGRGRQ